MVGFWCRCLHCSSVCLFSLTQILSFSHLLEHKQIHPTDEEHTIPDGIAPAVSYICINSFKSHRDGYGRVLDSQLPILLSKSSLKWRTSNLFSPQVSWYHSYLDFRRFFTLIWWWACYMANKRSYPTWTSVWKSRRVWGLGYLFRHVRSFVFYICIQLHPIYLDIPTAVTTTLSQELLVF